MIHLFRKPRWLLKRRRSADPKQDGPLLPRDLLKTYANSRHVMSAAEKYQFMMKQCYEQNEFPAWQMMPDSPASFVLADHYFDYVRARNIIPIRGEIDYFLESSAVLTNGEHIEFDAVLLCTGYQNELLYLPEHLRSVSSLYHDTFPIDTPGIAFACF